MSSEDIVLNNTNEDKIEPKTQHNNLEYQISENELSIKEQITQDQSNGKHSESTPNEKSKCCCYTKEVQMYVSHFLSSWGDRMWMFAGGLFLIEITPRSLRLVAFYECFLSLSVICFGASIGRWIDKTPRLRAAQISLFVQNSMVCLCTLILCLFISYKEIISTAINGWGAFLVKTSVILTACVAQIGTLGSKIAIEKDWIVVISGQDEAKLSAMNSVLRAVDLSTEIVAPVVVGFIMTSASMVVGGIAIASWNVLSLVAEYGLLRNLYHKVPGLRTGKSGTEFEKSANEIGSTSILFKMKQRATESLLVWRRYFSHEVRNAGLGLAFLFMTVLAFDNYSKAYIYENGVSKGYLGVVAACASVTGILGSIIFPFMCKKIGLLRTGVFGFGFETFCLTFCVASVFAPGSPFEPTRLLPSYEPSGLGSNTTFRSDSLVYLKLNEHLNSTSRVDIASEVSIEQVNGTAPIQPGPDDVSDIKPVTSVVLLLVGIILSRTGLWLADLTVTQILQKRVDQSERGAINGVQSSLNQCFSLLRSVALVILPSMETFGFHILISFAFIVMATILFCLYTKNELEKQQNLSFCPDDEQVQENAI